MTTFPTPARDGELALPHELQPHQRVGPRTDVSVPSCPQSRSSLAYDYLAAAVRRSSTPQTENPPDRVDDYLGKSGSKFLCAIPAVKQQNRMNAAAFTEESLRYFDEKTIEKPMWLDSADQVRLKGQLLFMNVVQAVSEASGIGVEQLEQNIAVLD
jgi:hypothetical protein